MNIYQEEHRIFRESVRKFCEKELVPELDRWEQDKFFPNSVFEKLGAQGFLGILIDEEWGGVAGDYIMAGAWAEEFGRVPAHGLTIAVNMHSLVVTPTLAKFGSAAAKERWLSSAVGGTAIGAYAFTEPGAGSDLTQVQTKATEDGDTFIINGSKTFITNGARADFVLLLTKTDASRGYDGYTVFLVDTKLPGFTVSRRLEKLGWHCSDTAELSLVDLRVDKSMVIGQVGAGWHQAMSSLEWERLMLTLNAIGGAEKCIEETLRYTSERKVFGRSVASFDLNKSVLFNLQTRLLASKAFAHQSLRMLQLGMRCRKEVSLLKLYACSLAIEIADRCLQLHGGYGYTTEFRPERWLRDLRLNTIGGGTNEIMARIATKEIFSN